MAFCTNCGQSLGGGVSFCPSCGTRVAAVPPESKIRGYKEKMFKGAEQRLKTTLQGQARSAAQKVFSKAAGEARRQAGEAISESFTSKEAVPQNPGKGVSGWIWIFLLLSILLALLSGVSGDLAFVVTGILAYGIGRVLILSAVILLLVLARKNKPKPMNWLAKILLLGQILLLTWILYNRIMGQYFDLSALVMAALLSTDLKLLFNGNK
jgi:cation transport ATPase